MNDYKKNLIKHMLNCISNILIKRGKDV
jgi:hypothetical protein